MCTKGIESNDSGISSSHDIKSDFTAICVQAQSANLFATFFTFGTWRFSFETQRLTL